MNLDELSLKATSLLRRTGLINVSKHALLGLTAIGIILIAFACWHFWPHQNQDFIASSNAAEASSNQNPESSAEDMQSATSQEIIVDVEGAVNSPGLYALPNGSRIGDAVDAAGGLTANAAPGAVNLAQIVNDGDQIIIYTIDERQGQDPTSSAADSGAGSSGASSGNSTQSSNGKVNINTASATELQQLSGVGPSLSERIVQYREANGRFKSIDEIQNVSGIGETRFASIKDKICV